MAIVGLIFHYLIQILMVLVIIDVILSYFLSPYQPIRRFLDRIVEPMLSPIRKILPRTGMIDFSPIILIILLQLLDMVLSNIFTRL